MSYVSVAFLCRIHSANVCTIYAIIATFFFFWWRGRGLWGLVVVGYVIQFHWHTVSIFADYLATKCGVLMMSLFVFFTTTMSVSFTLRETQTRMLKFTGSFLFTFYLILTTQKKYIWSCKWWGRHIKFVHP